MSVEGDPGIGGKSGDWRGLGTRRPSARTSEEVENARAGMLKRDEEANNDLARKDMLRGIEVQWTI